MSPSLIGRANDTELALEPDIDRKPDDDVGEMEKLVSRAIRTVRDNQFVSLSDSPATEKTTEILTCSEAHVVQAACGLGAVLVDGVEPAREKRNVAARLAVDDLVVDAVHTNVFDFLALVGIVVNDFAASPA
jgi:hypothetical protein